MRRRLSLAVALSALLVGAAPAAFANPPDDTPIVTRHTIAAGGRTLAYEAETGRQETSHRNPPIE